MKKTNQPVQLTPEQKIVKQRVLLEIKKLIQEKVIDFTDIKFLFNLDFLISNKLRDQEIILNALLPDKTLQSIADTYGISKQRVEQIFFQKTGLPNSPGFYKKQLIKAKNELSSDFNESLKGGENQHG